jgi:hypothetical protein
MREPIDMPRDLPRNCASDAVATTASAAMATPQEIDRRRISEGRLNGEHMT